MRLSVVSIVKEAYKIKKINPVNLRLYPLSHLIDRSLFTRVAHEVVLGTLNFASFISFSLSTITTCIYREQWYNVIVWHFKNDKMCHLHNVRLCIPLTIYVLNFLIGNTKDKSAIEIAITGHFNFLFSFSKKKLWFKSLFKIFVK